MEAYLHGTSTRKVDELVKALRADAGISKSEVSRICADLDTEVARFATDLSVISGSRMCSSTPPTARPESITGWCPRRW
ncbi:transposase [Mycobacterium kubicae]|uniref:transposase n=1 Tax=Mycobacterium kubicae TaxID=120959 RepID=UPI003D15FDCD